MMIIHPTQQALDNLLLERAGSFRREKIKFIKKQMEIYSQRAEENYDKYQEAGQPHNHKAYEHASEMLTVLNYALRELDERDYHYSAMHDVVGGILLEVKNIEKYSCDPGEAMEKVKAFLNSSRLTGAEYCRLKKAYRDAYNNPWEGFEIGRSDLCERFAESYDEKKQRIHSLSQAVQQILKEYEQVAFADSDGNQIVINAHDLEDIFFYAERYTDTEDTHYRAMYKQLSRLLAEAERAKGSSPDPGIAIDNVLETIRFAAKHATEYNVAMVKIPILKEFVGEIAGIKLNNKYINAMLNDLSELEYKEKSRRKAGVLRKAMALIKRMQEELNKQAGQSQGKEGNDELQS